MDKALQWLGVFVAVAVADVFWTKYFLAAANKQAIKAGYYSSLIILFTAITTRSYVHNGSLVIPACAGAFVGTWLTVKRHEKDKET